MISAVVLTKNEEKNIEDCLETLKWCDEIIIVDDYSEDETLEKLKTQNLKLKTTAQKLKVFQKHLENDFAEQRNFGLEKARGEWVFFVDADERVTKELAEEILKQVQNDNYVGFYLKRKDFLFGKWLEHGETGNINLLRLAKKGAGEWVRPVHETWQIRGKVGELSNPLLHYPHQTIGEFLQDINFYTDLNAQSFYHQGIKSSFSQILIYPAGKFINNYFLKLGFLDGLPGLIMAIFMSFHSFLTRAKLWQLQEKNETV